MQVAEAREDVGLHERYDGVVQDLSPGGVRSGLAALGSGPTPAGHDGDQVEAAEAGLRATYDLVEDHRRNPLVHLANLDLAAYDRDYAPAEERARARQKHLAAWPDAVDAAVESLDRVPRPVAESLITPLRGLAAGVEDEAALEAHDRLVRHVEGFASTGDPDGSLGGERLRALMQAPEAMQLDLGLLAETVDRERARLKARLADSAEQLSPGTPVPQLVASLLADHPNADGIYDEARGQIAEVTAFTIDRDLLADVGGECLVGPAPPSRRWAMAMMSWAAPYEADAPSWYYVTPPDESWPAEDQEVWLSVFSRTTLPAITVHEVTPGHYAHGRMLRRLTSDVRRTVLSPSFVEGWAHHTEELFVEEGFRAEDPRFAIGVFIEALVRVTRLACAIGFHSGAMTFAEAVARFEDDAFYRGPAARAEAGRATYDPTYGRYTWGKLEIRRLRDEAQARWGRRYSHRRFHEALLGLGAPPLGLMGSIFD